MKKVIKLTESDLRRIVKRVINEQMLYENIEVIDKILDKVIESGLESLSKSEKEILDKYSEWTKAGNHPVDFTWDEDEDEESNMFKYTGSFNDGSKIMFYTNERQVGNAKFSDIQAVTIKGEIIYNDIIYEGMIIVSRTTNEIGEGFRKKEEFDDDDVYHLIDKMELNNLESEYKTFLTECAYHYFMWLKGDF